MQLLCQKIPTMPQAARPYCVDASGQALQVQRQTVKQKNRPRVLQEPSPNVPINYL